MMLQYCGVVLQSDYKKNISTTVKENIADFIYCLKVLKM